MYKIAFRSKENSNISLPRQKKTKEKQKKKKKKKVKHGFECKQIEKDCNWQFEKFRLNFAKLSYVTARL